MDYLVQIIPLFFVSVLERPLTCLSSCSSNFLSNCSIIFSINKSWTKASTKSHRHILRILLFPLFARRGRFMSKIIIPSISTTTLIPQNNLTKVNFRCVLWLYLCFNFESTPRSQCVVVVVVVVVVVIIYLHRTDRRDPFQSKDTFWEVSYWSRQLCFTLFIRFF